MTDKLKVVPLDQITTNDVPPEKIIEGAAEEEFEDIVILGKLKDGTMYYASSNASIGDAFVMMDKFKLDMLQEIDF